MIIYVSGVNSMNEEYLLVKLLITNFILGILMCLNVFCGKLKSLNLLLITIFSILNIIIAIFMDFPYFLKEMYKNELSNKNNEN